ncbi:MAG: YdeI/OmpD-associated family protein [Polyangiaceae bacterium]
MPKKDKRVDAYIAKAPAFAKPLLVAMRAAIHAGCPDVEETIKWRMPSFELNGALLCHIAAFKEHCRFVFWHSIEISHNGNTGMELFGDLREPSDLPPKKELISIVKKAVTLNKKRAAEKTDRKALKIAAPKRSAKPVPKTPADLEEALEQNHKALIVFANFAPSHKRDYIEWIVQAKRAETRTARVKKAIAQMAAGKSLNEKYAPKKKAAKTAAKKKKAKK